MNHAAASSRPAAHRRAWLAQAGALACGLALPAAAARAQVSDLNDAINKAGRQRMLSQRMGKAWLALAHGVETAGARQVLERSIALFERQLDELQAFAPRPDIRATYAELGTAWARYQAALTRGAPAAADAAALLQADARVLSLAHQGTVQYEAAQAQPVGRLVNIAGRQRMLSQRMAKFCLAAALGVDAAAAQAEIAQARTEFLQAMQTLRQAPQATDRIRGALQMADAQWVFFDAALGRLQGGDGPRGMGTRALSEVFVASEHLLTVMDQVTGLYAAVKA